MKIRKYSFWLFLFFVMSACGGGDGGSDTGSTEPFTITQISDNGGRVAWYKGISHELIAFDRIVDDVTKDTEVYTMEPDGSNVTCVTCDNTTIPKGFIAQPEWHPNGEHIILQAENANSNHTRFNHGSWGIDQDLWIIKKDGTSAEMIYDNSATPLHAALHPHFNSDGSKLVFSERESTGVYEFIWATVNAPGEENPWAGWQIHLADFDISASAGSKLSNHAIISDNPIPLYRGFYETHGFKDDGTLVFSATIGGYAYVDDGYTSNLAGASVVNLTDSSSTWEEHASFSPSGNVFVFISSRVNPDWQYPGNSAADLRTELYMDKNGVITQLTSFNSDGDPDKRYLTSDFEWDREGRRIVVQVAPVDANDPTVFFTPEIWMITFEQPQ